MNLDDITCLAPPLAVPSHEAVVAAETSVKATFPKGYHDYITKLGEGVLGGSLIRVYPPWRIVNELDAWRLRIGQFWFWDDGEEILPKARAVECVVIGDTLNGDELIIHPNDPDRIFVLPRDDEMIFVAGNGLFDALEWLCSSGIVAEPFAEREFEPFDSRQN